MNKLAPAQASNHALAMAPKRLQELGGVESHGNGWRAVVHLAHGNERGPVRTSRCRADADLARMRGASSREGIPRIARAIRESAEELVAAEQPLHVGVVTLGERTGTTERARGRTGWRASCCGTVLRAAAHPMSAPVGSSSELYGAFRVTDSDGTNREDVSLSSSLPLSL